MRTLDELNEICERNSETIIKLTESNITLMESLQKFTKSYIEATQIHQSIFNDYVAVVSELTDVPESVIIQRVKDNSLQKNPQTNLFVVK